MEPLRKKPPATHDTVHKSQQQFNTIEKKYVNFSYTANDH